MEAERDLAGTWGDRVAAVEAHRARMEAVQQVIRGVGEESLAGGSARSSQMSEAPDYYIKEAAYWVAAER